MDQKITVLYTLTLAILLCSLFTETSFSQHVIGQETVNKVTQQVESGKKGRDASIMMGTEDLNPGGFYLFRLSVRGDYKPELEVTFDKANYEEGDEITMTIERKTANRRIVVHPHTREKIDEGLAWAKLPIWFLGGIEIEGITPDENGTIWLEKGESFSAKTILEKGRTSDTFHISMAAGNVNFGESREYILVKKQKGD